MGNNNYKKKCDGHAPTLVLELGGGVYAGSKHESKGQLTKFDIILNCTGSKYNTPKHDIPFDWGKAFQNPSVNEIVLDWYNNQAVFIKPDFWTVFRQYIIDKNLKVLVCCDGGHGRTGTAIVSLMLAEGTWKTWDAIKALRNAYCEEAVETAVQASYLTDLEEYFKSGK